MKDFDTNPAYQKIFGQFISGKTKMIHQTEEQLLDRIFMHPVLTKEERHYLRDNIEYIFEAGWNYMGPTY